MEARSAVAPCNFVQLELVAADSGAVVKEEGVVTPSNLVQLEFAAVSSGAAVEARSAVAPCNFVQLELVAADSGAVVKEEGVVTPSDLVQLEFAAVDSRTVVKERSAGAPSNLVRMKNHDDQSSDLEDKSSVRECTLGDWPAITVSSQQWPRIHMLTASSTIKNPGGTRNRPDERDSTEEGESGRECRQGSSQAGQFVAPLERTTQQIGYEERSGPPPRSVDTSPLLGRPERMAIHRSLGELSRPEDEYHSREPALSEAIRTSGKSATSGTRSGVTSVKLLEDENRRPTVRGGEETYSPRYERGASYVDYFASDQYQSEPDPVISFREQEENRSGDYETRGTEGDGFSYNTSTIGDNGLWAHQVER